MERLRDLFQIKKGITSVIGGGGKTSLILALARELSGDSSVIITTSTRILPPEDYPVIYNADEESIARALEKNPCIVVCDSSEDGKLMEPAIGIESLCRFADHVLVEADGSRQLPLKAHAEHEPAIPAGSNENLIFVVGADGFGGKIDDVCHRPKLYCDKLNRYYDCGQLLYTPDSYVSPIMAADMILFEGYGKLFFINKVESELQMKDAAAFADRIQKKAVGQFRVVAGSIQKGEYTCLY